MSWVEDIKNYVGEVFDEVVEFFKELPVLILEGITGAIATVVEAIPAPEFLVDVTIADYIDSDILWLLDVSSFATCLGIYAAGIGFYFIRRLATIGIW